MRSLTTEEMNKLLDTLARDRQGADMMLFDCICYGGQLEEYRDAKNHIENVIKAIPEDIRKAHDALKRKAKADAMRAEADRIEAGEPAH